MRPEATSPILCDCEVMSKTRKRTSSFEDNDRLVQGAARRTSSFELRTTQRSLVLREYWVGCVYSKRRSLTFFWMTNLVTTMQWTRKERTSSLATYFSNRRSVITIQCVFRKQSIIAIVILIENQFFSGWPRLWILVVWGTKKWIFKNHFIQTFNPRGFVSRNKACEALIENLSHDAHQI